MIVLRDSRSNQPFSLSSLINPPTIRVIDFYSQQFLQVSRNIIRYTFEQRELLLKKKKRIQPPFTINPPFLKRNFTFFLRCIFFRKFQELEERKKREKRSLKARGSS